jgi:hypothetical protein
LMDDLWFIDTKKAGSQETLTITEFVGAMTISYVIKVIKRLPVHAPLASTMASSMPLSLRQFIASSIGARYPVLGARQRPNLPPLLERKALRRSSQLQQAPPHR